MSKSTNLPHIVPPDHFNYLGIFLTFACNMKCPYCINKSGSLVVRKPMSGADWIVALNRIRSRADLPITLSGGEPTYHPDFYQIVNGVRAATNLDLLTNAQFDTKEFCKRIHPNKFRRPAQYASIRVSYHPKQHDGVELLERVRYLKSHGHNVGVWAVAHPAYERLVHQVKHLASSHYHIDFRLKEFLGKYKGVEFGSYTYPDALNAKEVSSCVCKTSELLVGPAGGVFRCHRDLYANEQSLGHILDDSIQERLGLWRPCDQFGHCNECDIKNKYDRFQQKGHCAVEISNIQ